MFYSRKVIKHFKEPHNYGKIRNPSGIGKVGNLLCGDVMYLYIKVDKNEIIKDIKYETFGCVAAIATSSIVTDLVKGKSVKKALDIDSKKVIKALGGLPVIKIHCSLLAIDALQEAIYDYLIKNKKPVPALLRRSHQRIRKQRT